MELPPRRDKVLAAAPVSQLLAGGAALPSKPRICEELLPGGEPKGQRAFEDGEQLIYDLSAMGLHAMDVVIGPL